MDIDTVDRLDHDAFVARFGGVFEASPWVAERAWAARPFGSLDALYGVMLDAVTRAPREVQMALIRSQGLSTPRRTAHSKQPPPETSRHEKPALSRTPASSRTRDPCIRAASGSCERSLIVVSTSAGMRFGYAREM